MIPRKNSFRFAVPAVLVVGVVAFSLIGSGRVSLSGLNVGYGYGTGSNQPFVSAVNPTNGAPAGGQTVTITGTNFATTVTVKFGATPGVVVSHTSSSITATNPGHAVGIVDVTVGNVGGGTWDKTNAYVYLNGAYTLDAFGGVHADGTSPAKTAGPYFASKLARSMVLLPGGGGGFVLDGWGGIHPWNAGGTLPTHPGGSAYFQGFDIARDIVLTSGSNATASSGYTLDGWGGIHPFGGAPAIAAGAPYFQGFDIAKRMVLFPDGKGGYVLDGWGGIHPFATGSNSMPAAMTTYGYFQGFNIARDFQLLPGSTETSAFGFTLDGYGGMHPFNTAAATTPTTPSDRPYWSGFDIARAIRPAPGTTASSPQGWILDGWGGLHEFNDSPSLAPFAYFVGQDIAKQLALN